MPADFKRFKTCVVDAIKESYELLGFWKIGGRAWWHPTGDICDGCGENRKDDLGQLGQCELCGTAATWKPHINILIPRYGLTDKGLKRIPGHLKSFALDNVKARVQEFFDAFAKRRTQTEQTANVWYNYRPPGAKSGHASSYFGRVFAAWKAALKLVPSGRSFGLLAGGGRRSAIGKLWALRVQVTKTEAEQNDEEQNEEECPCCASTNIRWGEAVSNRGRRYSNYLNKGYLHAERMAKCRS
jgi:hypothetical protein